MRIIASGATGFIGRALCADLLRDGHQVQVLTRDPERARGVLPAGAEPLQWDPSGGQATGAWAEAARGADGLVNLAGETIGEPRWSKPKKRAIRQSRLVAANTLVRAIEQTPAAQRPKVLVNASAVGYYGDRGDEVLDESNAPGSDFFAGVCRDWEAAARAAEPLGVRVVTPRFGLVLGEQPPGPLNPLPFAYRVLAGGKLIEEGGVLRPLLLLYRFFAGGPLGSGRQWWSWVHRDDVLGIVRFALEREQVSGALNATAPNPVRMNDFGRTLSRVLGRPHWAPAPAPLLRLVLGETADALLLSSQRVLPRATQAAGYAFRHTDLEQALRDVLSRSR